MVTGSGRSGQILAVRECPGHLRRWFPGCQGQAPGTRAHEAGKGACERGLAVAEVKVRPAGGHCQALQGLVLVWAGLLN